MNHRSRAARPTLARLAVGGALALTLAGCSVTNPITTHWDYAPSDGVIVDIGELRLGNALVLTAEEQAPGTLIGYVTNNGGEAVEVAIGVGGTQGAQFRVPGNSTVRLGPDGDEQVEIDAVPAAPGAKVEVLVRSDRDGDASSVVPVLDGTLEEYADLVP